MENTSDFTKYVKMHVTDQSESINQLDTTMFSKENRKEYQYAIELLVKQFAANMMIKPYWMILVSNYANPEDVKNLVKAVKKQYKEFGGTRKVYFNEGENAIMTK